MDTINVSSGLFSSAFDTSLNHQEIGSGYNTEIILQSGRTLIQSSHPDFVGAEYDINYSANFTPRSLVDREYVDNIAAGLDPKASVIVATLSAITGTYVPTGGSGGTGSFTGVSTTVIDGVTLVNGNRILVKNQVDAKQNGVYVRISSSVWERSPDMDGSPANEVSAGNYVFVETGTTYQASGWVIVGNGVLTLNTDNINWVQFSAAISAYIGGDGINITGAIIDVDLATNSGLDFTGGQLRVAPTIAGAGLSLTSGVLDVGASNGLTANGTDVHLGGTLTGDTTINTSTFGILLGTGTATGTKSFAVGCNVNAIGNYSHAEGYCTQSCGYASHAEGKETIACGNYSHAEGCQTYAIGYASHAEGFSNCACGSYSHAEGCQTVTCGQESHAEGASTLAYGQASHAEGYCTRACGNFSHAEGYSTNACGCNSHAEGSVTYAIGEAAHSEGCGTYACGNFSHAEGYSTNACGCSSHAGGIGYAGGSRFLIASGCSAFNHSQNTVAQTAGHGANAHQSAILGGINHNIEVGNTRAAIVGGNLIKLTGTTYIDTTAVANLAIMSAPSAGFTGDSVLVRRGTTGKIFAVSQASIAANGITANNGLTEVGGNVRLGGTLTGNTIIDTNGYGITFGTGSATGENSFSVGKGSIASGYTAVALGYNTIAGYNSIAGGGGARAFGRYSVAFGNYSESIGCYSTAIGNGTCAIGLGSSAFGSGTCAIGEYSNSFW
ncbi:MAG: hypothetical protein HC836_47240 [Richelia sp. RM2_1_2]|nr:hypothetical protein [Richelia sp. RM2_1_2]